MSEEATPQARSPVDTAVNEEATSHEERWGHPSPDGQITSPAPNHPDQSSGVYAPDPAPKVSPQPIRPGENEATLTELRPSQHQKQQQAGHVIRHIPQHPHHPHHKYQLLHGGTDSQQHIIQHSNAVLQHPSSVPQGEVSDQQAEVEPHSQGSEDTSQEPQQQVRSPYKSSTPSQEQQHPPLHLTHQDLTVYSTQQETHDPTTLGAPREAQAQTPATGKETLSIQHPSTIKEVFITQG